MTEATVAARLPLQFDTERMDAELACLPEPAWVSHFNPVNHVGDWSVVPLRAIDGDATRIVPAPGTSGVHADTPWGAASAYLREVVAAFACPTTSVRLMRLGAGARIHEHHDPDIGIAAGLVRLHVPIRTNPDVDFRVAGERVRMPAGSCWYLDLGRPHAVRNDGPSARVHLVLDCRVDDWLRELLAGAGVALPDPAAGWDGTAQERPFVIAALRRMGTEAALREAERLERGGRDS